MNAKIGFKKKLSRMIDIKSINSSDFISICLFNEITMFANKLVAININRNSFDINKFCVISKFKLLKILRVSVLWNNSGAVITKDPLKK